MNPIYVDDAVLAVRKAMTLKESHKINIAGPAVLSLRDMAVEIGRAVGKTPKFEVRPPGPPRDLVADTARMRSLLCEPRTSFGEGLAATLASVGA